MNMNRLTGSPMKVLLIEDSPRLRKSIQDYLQDVGFAVDVAEDGGEGWHKLSNWTYDALILDMMIPEPDGWTILQGLRDKGNRLPVVILTALTSLDDRVRGLNGGADDYLVKPFDMRELVARVQSVIRRGRQMPEPEIAIGGVRINTSDRSVHVDGQKLELSAREYALLEILAVKKGAFVPRDYLYEHLFDERDDSLSNLMDVYIYKLRQKLGKARIQSRRGLGYKLVD